MSSVKVKADVIDADAHVVENERVWDYLEPSEEKFRPTLAPSPQNPEKQIWVLDGENLGSKFPSPNEKQSQEHLRRFGREVGTPIEARELSDVKQRLQHMDELGIDVQVLYNSLWITPLKNEQSQLFDFAEAEFAYVMVLECFLTSSASAVSHTEA